MSNEKRDSTGVGVQIDAPTPTPNSDISNDKMFELNLPQPLTMEEKKYLLAVERGDLANVRRILQRAHRKQHININCMDPLGRRALTLAIDSENLEMVELLIIMGVDTKDSLLLAINAEFVEAVELLLEHEELIHKDGDLYSWQKVDVNTAMFAPDITPLILAAHKNNYEILKILLDRGAALPVPHDIRCGCEECLRLSSEDALRLSLARVNMYRALASPSLISLTSNDPLLTAFELSWVLRNLAFTEQECKNEYMELRRQCQRYAVDLLDQTRNSKELAMVLNHDPDLPPYEDGDRMHLSRLELAIKYKQKKFVAHPNIQQLLASIWYEGVPGFRRKSPVEKLLTILKVTVLFPIYCMIYMLAPNCTTGKLMRKPFMKFLTHAASYLFFLFILLLVSQRAEEQVIRIFGTEGMKRLLEERMRLQRGNGPTFLEMIVVLYVIGFIWEEFQEIYTVGIKDYLRNMWNFIDFTRNSLYVSVFVLRVIAYIQQVTEIHRDPRTAYIPREQWDDFDPQLIAEGLFAGANIFSAIKLVHLFSVNPHLGPLQISLGRMVIDIVKFFFIYTLVLFAFACGLNQLLWYFADLEEKKCYSLPGGQPDWDGNSDACMKWRRFGNLFESSQSLFWASFGMVGLENFELEGIKTYTRFWGLLMFGSYSVINVIVLLNLLIAMMSNSYAMIDEHSDTEWKFARTKLWKSYFEDSATLPPPFNIMPSVKWLIRIFRKSSKEIARKRSLKRMNQNQNRYENIMRALVWRYVAAQHRKYDDSAVTEDDINEVKTEVSAFRYEMLEIFGRNGMDVSSAAKKEKPVRGKRTKVWERRLMKDFQVAVIQNDSDRNDLMENNNVIDEIEPPTTINEDPKSKFKRIARQIANDSVAHKWNEILKSVVADSQIGRCHNRDSFRNQQNLFKAIEEAKKLVLLSPKGSERCCSPIDFIDDAGSSLIDILNEISAEVGNNKNFNEKINTLKNKQEQQQQHHHQQQLQSQQLPPPPPPPLSTKNDAFSKSPLIDTHKPITPPPMFSNSHLPQQDIFEIIDKATTTTTNQTNSSSNNLEKTNLKDVIKKNLPEIKITVPDNQQILLNPTGLITLKAPPGKAMKKAPPPPPGSSSSGAVIAAFRPKKGTSDGGIIDGLRRRSRSPSPTPVVGYLRKSDSLPDATSDAPIIFVSLNDSTEKLIPRSLSPVESDTSTLPPNSPRLAGRFSDIEMVKRKAGWL